MYVALFVVAIAAIIMFHEFGHFATAKLFGMKVEKFFLSFGPTLWSVRRGETEYGVKAIPLGGFVKISGMNRFEHVDPADRGRLFYEKPAWQRVIVLIAGSATHFLVAFVLLWAALAFTGVPSISTRLEALVEGSPAAEAGLQPGDELLAVDGVVVGEWQDAQRAIRERGGRTVDVRILRDGVEQTVPVQIAAQNPEGLSQGYLGVLPGYESTRYGPIGALGEAVSGEWSLPSLTRQSLAGIASVFTPAALADFFSSVTSGEPRSVEDGGPVSLVGAGQAVNVAGQSGNIFGVLLLLASLNIVIGALNLLPLPPLDGGHVAVLAIEEGVNATRGRRGERERWALDPSVVTPIALAVIVFFGVIALTAMFADVFNPIQMQ